MQRTGCPPASGGTRAITPNDTWPGAIKFIKEEFKNVKKVSSVNWDLGPLNQINSDDLRRRLTDGGLQMGLYELAKIGATDYSAALQKIKSDNPDVVFLGIFGNDIGVFMKQYVTIALSGDGADDMFGSYGHHRLVWPLAQMRRGAPSPHHDRSTITTTAA